jgi:hypothetical protein
MVPKPILGALYVQHMHPLLLRLASSSDGWCGCSRACVPAGGVHRLAAQVCTPWLVWSCCMLVRVRMASTE